MAFSSSVGVSSWTYFENQSFEADYPISTAYAWLLRNNLAHLQDSAGQFRINWSALATTVPGGTDGTSWSGTAQTMVAYYAAPFPVTLLGQDGLPGLDIRIAVMSSSGESVTAEARIVYDVGTVWNIGAEVLWTATGSSSSTTGAWVIDEDSQGSPSFGLGKGRIMLAIREGGDDSQSAIEMVRLEIKLTSTVAGSSTMRLMGVMIREFPVWF